MIKLYNTLSRRLEELKPIHDKEVRLYTCGPTVYHFAHIGNLRTYLFEDILRRVLQYNGYKVIHGMNITDVGHLVGDGDEGEDKMEVGAKREGKHPLEIAKFYENKFFEDLKELNILPPDHVIKATDSIPEQIEIIRLLEEKGFTYRDKYAIYFDTSKLADYGKLTGQKLSEKKVGSREDVVVDSGKKNPADFALWFFLEGRYKNHILHWPSPWGEGFPGWHIECSAISRKILGQPFDIHTGGVDHIGTHHTNEIAQSEAGFGMPLANIWMHGEFLLVASYHCENCGYNFTKPASIINVEVAQKKDEFVTCPQCGFSNYSKMSKSGDNFITLESVKEKGFSALDYRYLCLTAHYRSQLNFTWESLEGAHTALQRLWSYVTAQTKRTTVINQYKKRFVDAISNDLDMPRALALVWELIADKEYDEAEKVATILDFDVVLGFNLASMNYPESINPIPIEVLNLKTQREEARKSKNFKLADELRKEIEDLGYDVMDTPEGQKVRKKI